MRYWITAAKAAGLLAVTALCTYVVLRLTRSFALQTHSWLFGGGAFLFGIAEMFFARLLTELSNVLRYPGFSVWQSERLRQVIKPFKRKAWRLWVFSQLLRATSAVCAVVLAQPNQMTPHTSQGLLWTGYSCLLLATWISLRTWYRFIRIDEFRDNISFEEAQVKEKKRLSSELAEGEGHDFESDKGLNEFNKPPEGI